MTRKLKKKEDPEFPPIHVLLCGDRDYEDDYIISIFISGLKLWHGLNVHLWHGDARGADSHGKLAAAHAGIQHHPFPADWERYGKAAGMKRNITMLRAMLQRASESPNSVVMGIAFKDDIRPRSGTRNMVELLLKADVPVYVVSRPLLEELKGG